MCLQCIPWLEKKEVKYLFFISWFRHCLCSVFPQNHNKCLRAEFHLTRVIYESHCSKSYLDGIVLCEDQSCLSYSSMPASLEQRHYCSTCLNQIPWLNLCSSAFQVVNTQQKTNQINLLWYHIYSIMKQTLVNYISLQPI